MPIKHELTEADVEQIAKSLSRRMDAMVYSAFFANVPKPTSETFRWNGSPHFDQHRCVVDLRHSRLVVT